MENASDIEKIKKVAEELLGKYADKKIILFPYGEAGKLVKRVLNESYGIYEEAIVDSYYSKYNPNVLSLDYLKQIDTNEYILVYTLIGKDLESLIREYSIDINIIKVWNRSFELKNRDTIVGKYSYGPLCNHWLVESVGAFCSFAENTDVVANHPTQYVSTHPFIFHNPTINDVLEGVAYEKENGPWCFEGIMPKGIVHKLKRIKIGNDVWLGKGVTITNGANIGNGVIAGANSVITKDVPDYAVVVGSPARIIKFRYTSEQIEALNKICWWDWSDEKIRECYDDFFAI